MSKCLGKINELNKFCSFYLGESGKILSAILLK